MAMYKVRYTVYKDPEGKTLKGPTFTHLLGDICSAFGLFGILGTILALMENYGMGSVIGNVVLAVVGFALMVVLHKRAKKNAEAKILEMLAQQKGQAMTSEKSD